MSAHALAPTVRAEIPGLQTILDVTCNDESNDFIFGSGWALPEPRLRWAIGHHSDIIIRPACWQPGTAYGRIYALIEATPFLGLDFANPQHILVSLNGHMLREVHLSRGGVIGFWIPPEFIGRPLMIGLGHLGARTPASFALSTDERPLAFAFHRLQIFNIPNPSARLPAVPAAMSAAEILGQFESLGDNCEFGLVQRSAGIEPLGLFRFTATPLPSLLDGLLHEFAGLGGTETISLDVRGDVREYILTDQRWNLTYHTFVLAADMPPERVIQRESQKLTLLRRRMLDDLRAARRIYIVKHNAGLAEEDAMALFLLLNRFGPNRLAVIAPATAEHPANMREITPGLVAGQIETLAPYDAAAEFSADAWVKVCRQALDFLAPPPADRSRP